MPFSDLPREIHVQILSLLDYKAFTFLRATNRYFYELPSKNDIKTVLSRYEHEECVADFYGQKDYLPCYTCMRMLPETAFARKQIRFTRAFGHKDYKKRSCFECGVREVWQVSQPDPIQLPDGSWYHLCPRCHYAGQTRDYRTTLTQDGLHHLCATCRIKSLDIN